MKTIEITVDPKGNCQVETKGFAGAKCLQASQFIEVALGKRNGIRNTAEFYNPEPVQNNLENKYLS